MAGGKIDPALQKMINLMYLVFIAMLANERALKEVISGFGFI